MFFNSLSDHGVVRRWVFLSNRFAFKSLCLCADYTLPPPYVRFKLYTFKCTVLISILLRTIWSIWLQIQIYFLNISLCAGFCNVNVKQRRKFSFGNWVWKSIAFLSSHKWLKRSPKYFRFSFIHFRSSKSRGFVNTTNAWRVPYMKNWRNIIFFSRKIWTINEFFALLDIMYLQIIAKFP